MPMQVRLIIVGGKADRAELTIKLPSVVGRDRKSGLRVAHPMISRQHCEIFEADGLVMIRDLDSLNGTLMAGRRVKQSALPPGSKFTLGPLTFRMEYAYRGDLGNLPQPVFLEPAAASSVTAEPEAPDFEVVEEPAPIDATSVRGDRNRAESDEIVFDDFSGQAAAASEIGALAETKGDELAGEDQRIDFLRALEEAEVEEAVGSKESEVDVEIVEELKDVFHLDEKPTEEFKDVFHLDEKPTEEFKDVFHIDEKPAVETPPTEPVTVEEPEMDIDAIEAPAAVEESEPEFETVEESETASGFFEELPVEAPATVVEEEPEIAFEPIEESATEAEPPEPLADEESEPEFETAEESETASDFFEELPVEAPATAPVVEEEPEVAFEPVEETATEAESAEPAVAEEPEAEAAESLSNFFEKLAAEGPATAPAVDEEPQEAVEPIEEAATEAEPVEPAAEEEPEVEFEAAEEMSEVEEPDTKPPQSPATDSYASVGSNIDTSIAMGRLASRKHRSWLGRLVTNLRKKRADRAAKREAAAAESLSGEEITPAEPPETDEQVDFGELAEEPPIDEQVDFGEQAEEPLTDEEYFFSGEEREPIDEEYYSSEEEDEPIDEPTEDPAEQQADPVDDLLKDFIT